MPSVFESVRNLLAQGDTMDRLGAALGTDRVGTQKAVDAATPAVLGGAADRIEKPGGVGALSQMMQSASDSPQSGWTA